MFIGSEALFSLSSSQSIWKTQQAIIYDLHLNMISFKILVL